VTRTLIAHYRKIGRKGGKARARKLSAERRAQIARMGGRAKAAKHPRTA